MSAGQRLGRVTLGCMRVHYLGRGDVCDYRRYISLQPALSRVVASKYLPVAVALFHVQRGAPEGWAAICHVVFIII